MAMVVHVQERPNLLREWVDLSGYKIVEIAAEVDIPRSSLYQYLDGAVSIPPDRLRKLAHLFGCRPEQIVPARNSGSVALDLVQSTVSTNKHHNVTIIAEVESSKMDQLRRKLILRATQLTGVVSTVPQVLLNHEPWEELARTLAKPAPVRDGTVKHLEYLTDHYWGLYRDASSKRDLLATVLSHLHTSMQLVRGQLSTDMQYRLCGVISNTAQIAGEIYFDMNDINSARNSYQIALEASQEVGYQILSAIGLGRMGFLSVYSGDYLDSLPFLVHAQRIADQNTSGRSRAWLATMEAEAYSLLQEESKCNIALERAEIALQETDTSVNGNWTGFNPATFMGYKGICLLRLGKSEAARSLLMESYKDFDETPTRRKSITLTDIALTHIQQGTIDYGVELAQQSLAIAAAAKSPRAVQRVRDLQQDLHPWRNMASVKALGKQIIRFPAQ